MAKRNVYSSSMKTRGTKSLSRRGELCTVSFTSTGSCDRVSIEGAPIAICFKHAMETYNFLAAELASIPDETAESILATPETRRDLAWRTKLPDGDHVYYVEVDGLVKIGHTSNLKQRLYNYPPTAVLLGVEAGGRELERRRHAQFAHYLKMGREWHSRGEGILRHVRELNGNTGTPVQLGLFPKAA